MNIFALNMLLMVVWCGLWADFSVFQLLVGFHVGFAALWTASPLFGERSPYFKRAYRAARLALFFLYDLAASSVRVAWDVLTPTHRSKPAIIEVPLDVESDLEILLVTNLISLTPGTLSLDVLPDRRTLIVHDMFGAEHPERQIAYLKNGIERMVREVFE